MPTDYYELLGVDRNAGDDEIKRAFRKAARECHPDFHPGDAEAEARFKALSVAYETLSDPERRRRYDVFGPEGTPNGPAGGGPGFGAFGDIFDAFFGGDPFGTRRGGGPPRGEDAETIVALTLHEAAFGTTETIEVNLPGTCDRCGGSGCEPGTHPERCAECGGSGEVRQVRRTVLGQMVTAGPCFACGATGSTIPNPCTECRGEGRVRTTRSLDVEVPAGIDDGQRLRLAGRGAAAPRGGPPGDLFVTVRVAPDPDLVRDGRDLVHSRRLPMTTAALGATITVPTLEGPEEVEVPAGTQPGEVIRLKGRGVPSLRGRGRGDLLVHLEVVVPSRLTDEEAELLRRFAEAHGDDVGAEHEGGFFHRIRSAFQ